MHSTVYLRRSIFTLPQNIYILHICISVMAFFRMYVVVVPTTVVVVPVYVIYLPSFQSFAHLCHVSYLAFALFALVQLLRVLPKGNSLSLVYKDPETMSFVKYINSKDTVGEDASNRSVISLNATFFPPKQQAETE